MGWNSANEIFDPVAHAVIDSYIDRDSSINILTTLIRGLQAGDWDTEDESLEEFKAWPVAVEAFKRCGVPYRDDYDEEWTADTADYRLSVEIKRLDSSLPLPTYASDGDAGVDLYCTSDFILGSGQRMLIPTGIAVAIPKGCAGLVHPRSGLAHKLGLTVVNSPGTIDAGYRGEIKVNIINLGQDAVAVNKGSRIAQLIFQKVEEVQFIEVDELPVSVRGQSGHGSTGF